MNNKTYQQRGTLQLISRERKMFRSASYKVSQNLRNKNSGGLEEKPKNFHLKQNKIDLLFTNHNESRH